MIQATNMTPPGQAAQSPPTQARGGQLNDPDQVAGSAEVTLPRQSAGPAYHTYTRAAAQVYDRSTVAGI